jgi:aspartyl-tRNA(Asn)/glutamyl-tRNA(Gln) amidotransferase subunit C
MKIGRDEVLHVARLAELAVDEAELPRLVEQLDGIVAYVAQLDTLPSEPGAAAFHPGPAQVAWREDKVQPVPLAHSPAQMAPEFREGFFVVPRLSAMEEA